MIIRYDMDAGMGITRGKSSKCKALSFDVRGNNEYEFIKLPDTLKQNDVVFLPDSLIRDTLSMSFSKIKEVAYEKWTKELYKMIFVNPEKLTLILFKRKMKVRSLQALPGKRRSVIFT